MKKSGVLAVAAILASAGWAHADEITNGSFETGDFSGWTVAGVNGGSGVGLDGQLIGGAHWTTFVNVHSGDFAAYAPIAASNGDFLQLTQTISVSPGTPYSVGYYAGMDSPSAGAVGFYKNQNSITVDGEALDLLGLNQSTPLISGNQPEDMRHVFASYLTAQDQLSLTVSFYITGSGTGRAGFSVDDFHFDPIAEPVPEPATLALLGVGGLGYLVARRRKRVRA